MQLRLGAASIRMYRSNASPNRRERAEHVSPLPSSGTSRAKWQCAKFIGRGALLTAHDNAHPHVTTTIHDHAGI